METLNIDSKYLVHANMFEEQYQLSGVSWELEEELEKQNIRVEWESSDQGNKAIVINNSPTMVEIGDDKRYGSISRIDSPKYIYATKNLDVQYVPKALLEKGT